MPVAAVSAGFSLITPLAATFCVLITALTPSPYGCNYLRSYGFCACTAITGRRAPQLTRLPAVGSGSLGMAPSVTPRCHHNAVPPNYRLHSQTPLTAPFTAVHYLAAVDTFVCDDQRCRNAQHAYAPSRTYSSGFAAGTPTTLAPQFTTLYSLLPLV